MNLLYKFQNIDRRILYLLAVVILAIPLLIKPSKHPDVIFPEVQRAYRTIDSVPKGKIVLISNSWSWGSYAENGPQYEALIRHMFRKKIKFAVMSWDPAGTEITYQYAKKIEKAEHAKYGRDWAHFGFKTGSTVAIIGGIAENFPKVMNHDKFGTKISDLPAVAGVKNSKQIGAVVVVSSVGIVDAWISYMTTPKHVPLIFCPTAVMSAEAYPYLDSGQMRGMLNGIMGAVQYETLIGRGHIATDASATSWALSAAHIFIILLIILGNLGYLAARRSGRRASGGPRVG